MDSMFMPVIRTILQILETWINYTYPNIKLGCRTAGQFNLPVIPVEIQVVSKTSQEVLFSYLVGIEKKHLTDNHQLFEEVNSKLQKLMPQLFKDLTDGI